MLDLLVRLNDEHGKTIVMVTHDPKAAEHARRTIHLDKGAVVEVVENRPAKAAEEPPASEAAAEGAEAS